MRKKSQLVVIFIVIRMAIFLSLPLEGLTGYGDLGHFYGWARLDGWPFLDYWMEFPPLFPLLAEFVYRLVGGREQAFYYLLAGLFTLAQAANLALFLRIANLLNPATSDRRGWLYFAAITGLFYGWTYFDPIAVLALLGGTWFMLQNKTSRAGLAFGFGALVKWFPVLGLTALLKKPGNSGFQLSWRPALAATAVILAGWGSLLLISPEFTSASLRSQSAKGSWETPWALLDGNVGTGNFGAKEERYNPATAIVSPANSPVQPPILTLIPFALLGAWVFFKSDPSSNRSRLALIGLALCLFFLWSPGWSPQWVLYLLPFILLLLPEQRAILISALLILVNLLEWPLLLSRGMFWGLYLTIPLRTMLIGMTGVLFWLMIKGEQKN